MRLKKGVRAGRGARVDVPTPRSDNGKKETSTSIANKVASTETMTAPAVYLSAEEQHFPARACGAEEATFRLNKQGVEEAVTTVVWEKEQEIENGNGIEVEDKDEHGVADLPV
jgi:hypothetical protein